jgi:hypothetical protein
MLFQSFFRPSCFSPLALPALEGVVMELKDCAFPTLAGVTATSQLEKGFDGVDYALLVGMDWILFLSLMLLCYVVFFHLFLD